MQGQSPTLNQQKFVIYCVIVFSFWQMSINPTLAMGSAYIGNIVSLKFHISCCPYAQMMSLSKRRYFDNYKLGKALGMRPCQFCQPKVTRTVSAKIVDLKSKSDISGQ